MFDDPSQDLSNQNMKNVFQTLCQNNIDYVGYGRIDHQGQWTGYFSNDQWKEIYLEKNLWSYEPLMLTLTQTSRPLLIWDLATIEDKQDIMKQRAQVCAIEKGLSLQMQTDKGQEFLSLGFRSNHLNCIDFFINHQELIRDQFKQLTRH